MKKINPWLILLLGIVTFGVYPLVWHILRRREMIEKYKQPIPHWMWLIVPVFAMAAWVPLLIVAVVNESEKQLIFALIGLVICALLGMVIRIWWMWQFAKAAAYVTNGKLSAGWTLALYILADMHIFFLQYYFNRAENPKELKGKPRGEPSQKFINLAVAAIIVPNVAGWFLGGYIEKIFKDPELPSIERHINLLTEQYGSCMDKLNADFYEVTDENEAAYDAAYEHCDDIYIRINNTVDDYNDRLWPW